MTGFAILLFIFVALLALDIAAVYLGVDSRDLDRDPAVQLEDI